jgi:alpha-galactosidase
MDDITSFAWGNDKVDVEITYGPDRPPAITRIAPHGSPYPSAPTFEHPQAAVQITADGLMQENFGSRYSETLVGNDLRHVAHRVSEDSGRKTLEIEMRSKTYGLKATLVLEAFEGAAAIRAHVIVTNVGETSVSLASVTSLSAYVRLGTNDAETWDIASARSDWLAEGRWRRERARDYELVRLLNVDSSSVSGEISPTLTPYGATMTRTSTTSRSTSSVLPAGALIDRASGEAMFWQVEAMGPWLWQIGERVDGFYLVLSGPTDIEHHWSVTLAPNESFTTVNATVAVSTGELDGAIDEMTRYRRRATRPHGDHERMPVIFNDYMNTLMGDPTTAKELPLIDAAAAVGAECYCVDCGWYDDTSDWWPSVGEWHEAPSRFPNGLSEVIDHIRARGMRPGIWLEPEVIGIKSPMAAKLPDDAFMQRGGKRIQTHLRYLLDFRHPAARAHLDETVDRLVNGYGIEYFKLDYNVNSGAGTDVGGVARGQGQLEAARAYLGWLSGVLDQHPGLTIETCSSGSMRCDPALLNVAQLQSTSDQQDFREYANIAASAPAMMLPEQCGNWAYPNKSMTLPETRFVMLNGIIGRLYLSGKLTEMGKEQLDEVRRALDVHKTIRYDIAHAVPFWPLGLPQWNDTIISLGLSCNDTAYVAVWAKHGLKDATELDTTSHILVAYKQAQPIYGSACSAVWSPLTRRLTVTPKAQARAENPFCTLLKLS